VKKLWKNGSVMPVISSEVCYRLSFTSTAQPVTGDQFRCDENNYETSKLLDREIYQPCWTIKILDLDPDPHSAIVDMGYVMSRTGLPP